MTDIQNKALYIAEQCRKAGMTMAGAAGVLKNVEAEGVWDSGNLEDSYNARLGVSDAQYVREVDAGTRNFIDGCGFGLIQWTYWSRKRALLNFARARGVSVSDFKMQVDFLTHEMSTEPEYRSVWNLCCSSNDPVQCCHDICLYYENPANAEDESNRRASDVQKWYNFLASASSSGTESDIPEEKPAEPDTETTPHWPPRMLCKGMLGSDVMLLQAILNCRGYGCLIDGIFQESLDKKVRQFQQEAGIGVDGIAGPITWKALGVVA